MRISKWITAIILIVLISATAIRALSYYHQPKENFFHSPEILIFSIPLLFIAYLLFSFRYPRLFHINLVIIINILVISAGVELFMRFFPKMVPMNIAELLPENARRHIAVHHGFFSKDIMQGEGMLYSFNPHKARRVKPFQIDDFGYRNPEIPENEVDVVLLGDSLLIAQGVEKDLGELLREKGISAYNLGMGGYGPLTSLDSYKKYIIDREIKHKQVIYFLCLNNDIKDTSKYIRVQNQRGNYKDYLGVVPSESANCNSPLWFFSLLLRIPSMLFEGDKNLKAEKHSEDELVNIKLPYTEFKDSLEKMNPNYINPVDKLTGEHYIQAITEIVLLALKRQAKVTLVPMPHWAGIYGRFVEGHIVKKKQIEFLYWDIPNGLRFRFGPYGCQVIDPRSVFIEATKKAPITLDLKDYHLNARGIEILFNLILAHF